MLEFWCIVLYLALAGSSIWLILALAAMLGGES